MPIIAPCVTATTPQLYQEQIESIAPFAQRIHVDFMDGDFAPTKSIAPVQAWWPRHIQADIHVMFRRPLAQLETLISLQPNMIIVHAEAEGDIAGLLRHVQKLGIKAGIALLQETMPGRIRQLLEIADHALIFSGDLGHFGGQADMALLEKVAVVRDINPEIEIGWDGGVKQENVQQIVAGGVTVVNAGGAIQKAADPARAYSELTAAIETRNPNVL